VLAPVAFSRLGPARSIEPSERLKQFRRSKHVAGLNHAGKRAVPGPWPSGPSVRPWTRPQFRGLFSVFPDWIGFPTDMGCIGQPEGLSVTRSSKTNEKLSP
jgi:hypothetical protein